MESSRAAWQGVSEPRHGNTWICAGDWICVQLEPEHIEEIVSGECSIVRMSLNRGKRASMSEGDSAWDARAS